MRIDQLHIPKRFTKMEDALSTAKEVSSHEDMGWTYSVVQDKFQYMIEVKDEDNNVVGYM